jgi:hypothetical protein
VSDLGCCVAKARERAVSAGAIPVMGLIAGWGTVAVHGEEGFRAQRTAILCLFSDSIWESWLDPLASRRSIWWYRSWKQLTLEGWSRGSADALQRLALEYGVPMVRLGEAVQSGLLAERSSMNMPETLARQNDRLARPLGAPDLCRTLTPDNSNGCTGSKSSPR